MDRLATSKRRLVQIMTFGSPVLALLFAWTGWDAARRLSWRYANPVTWGLGGFFDGLAGARRDGVAAAIAGLLAFYRSDPWGNWVLVDHLGLKILLSFLLCWDGWTRGRRVWPYVAALYVVGTLAPFAYLWPILRDAAPTEAEPRLERRRRVAAGSR